MAKTKEELNKLKEEYAELTSKLKELSNDELKIVIGGIFVEPKNNNSNKEFHFYSGDVDENKFED